MLAYGNNQFIDLQSLKVMDGSAPKYYEGTDIIKKKIAQAWKELDQRFWNKGELAIFKTPGIVSGHGAGSRGYAVPRAVKVKTRQGEIPVYWYENIREEGGKKVYTPVVMRMGVEQKTLALGPEEIEKAIWMFAFNPHTINESRMNGKTYLEDKEAEAMKYAETETNAAVVSYWLFRAESPFYSDDDKLSTLCLAWGINPEGKSITYRKQLIAEAVKKAERQNDIEFNLKAFNSACEKLKDGQDTYDIEILALIQRCVNKRIIRFDGEAYKWTLLGTDGKTVLKTVCKVPPQQAGMSKTILRAHLKSTPDDFYMLQSAANGEPEPSKQDRVLLSVPLPAPEMIDEAFLKNDLSWPDRKNLWKYFGGDLHGVTDSMIVPLLLEKLVLNKIEVPWEVKKK